MTDPARLSYLPEGQLWPELKAAVKVVSRRDTPAGVSVATSYYLSSCAAGDSLHLAALRSHWSIENSRRRSRDVTFHEYQCRVR